MQEHLEGRCKDEDGAEHRDSEECPEKNPVQHLSHKLPVLYYLEEAKNVHHHHNYHDLHFHNQIMVNTKKSLVLTDIFIHV